MNSGGDQVHVRRTEPERDGAGPAQPGIRSWRSDHAVSPASPHTATEFPAPTGCQSTPAACPVSPAVR